MYSGTKERCNWSRSAHCSSRKVAWVVWWELRLENIRGQVIKALSYQANKLELDPEGKGGTIE